MLALFGAVTSAGLARAGSIAGAFVEPPARTPLAAVEVVVLRASDSALVAHASSDANGTFRIAGVEVGTYRVRATLLGHAPFTRTGVVVSAAAPDVDLGTLALAVAPVAVSGVTSSTSRPDVILDVDRTTYLAKGLPNANTGSATDLMRSVPELDVDLEGHVSLRGSSGVNILIDGRKPPMQGDALTAYLRQLPANRVERIEVVTNPSAKYDPEGNAGVVNLVLVNKVDLGLSGSLYGSAGGRYDATSARIVWQKGPLTWFANASGTRSAWKYDSHGERTGLLTTPPSTMVSNSASHQTSHYGSLDVSSDWALTKRATLYASFQPYRYSGSSGSDSRTVVADSSAGPTRAWDRDGSGDNAGRMASGTLGWSHVVKSGRDERSIELMQSESNNDSGNDVVQGTSLPAGVADVLSRSDGASGYRQRSLQADDTRPLGAKGKVEAGYRAAERVLLSSTRVQWSTAGDASLLPADAVSDYRHREVFHSGYLTVGTVVGRLAFQLGARGELAHTTLDVHSTGHRYAHDYKSLFPNGNVAWDFGRGRTLRASYSRRIDRPSAYQVNPDVPVSDTLNRFVGNPSLGPSYTHSLGLDASWRGARGMLRMTPTLRLTRDGWDRVTTVDARGVATTTFRNAASVRTVGVNVFASLPPAARLTGSIGCGVSREHHDASNLSSDWQRDATSGSANANLTLHATKRLDTQLYLRWAPATTLAQGRSSAYVGSSLGVQWKPRSDLFVNADVNDPLGISKYTTTLEDATYRQSNRSNNHMRSVSAACTWSWGKPPEEKRRKQSAEPAPGDGGAPGN